MSFFSKKKNDDLFFLLDSDKSFVDSTEPSFKNIKNPVTLTPQEVLENKVADNTSCEASSALESLKKRIQNAGTNTAVAEKPEEKSNKIKQNNIKYNLMKDVQEKSIELKNTNQNKNTANSEIKIVDYIKDNSKPNSYKEKKSLLEKCKPFLTDEDGDDSATKSAPTYKLESVADILKSQSLKTIDNLSKKYELTFDDLGKNHTDNEIKSEKNPIKVEKQIYEDILPSNKEKIKTKKDTFFPVISDIDKIDDSDIIFGKSNQDNSSTIKFTPVTDDSSTTRISVSSMTSSIDLTGELTQLSDQKSNIKTEETELEKNEFQEFKPKEEFSDNKDIKKYIRKFSLKKRASFLKTSVTIILTLLILVFKLPFMSEVVLSSTKICMIICTAIMGIIISVNYDMFKSLSKFFSKESTSDIGASLSTVFVLAYAITGIIKNEITLNLIIILCIILVFRSLLVFYKNSALLTSFKQIAVPQPKRAIRLIDDTAVTFAMAKSSIDGDVLTAAPQFTDHVNDFMKYNCFNTFMNGKYNIINIVSVVLSIILGFATFAYYDGIIYGFYAASVIMCMASLPIIFLIDTLPFYSASKKLSKIGAMISGKIGAEHIEKANSIVLNSEDLFPSGTVTLHHMKVLAENSIDDTIIRAASLTDSLGSSLSDIFKKIAGTGNISVFPDADTVKYEDKMGISGWVDNKLLFIGNRTLMETHNIPVPPVEVDHKILRGGFFPVYVASEDKVCALLVVQYSVKPEIARELRKTTGLGVTLLINSADPHLTEEMICDYFGLYTDTVKVMSNAGCHMYKNTVPKLKSLSAPAAYKGNPIGLPSIINCASKIKKSNLILIVLYILFAVLGAVIFTYSSFDGSGTIMSGNTILLYILGSILLTLLLFFTEKP